MKKQYLDWITEEKEVSKYLHTEEHMAHLAAMTDENLHRKGAIAVELARRDIELKMLIKGITRFMREELDFFVDSDEYLLNIIKSFSKDISKQNCPICEGKSEEHCVLHSISIGDREYKAPMHYHRCVNSDSKYDCRGEEFVDHEQVIEREDFLRNNTPWQSK